MKINYEDTVTLIALSAALIMTIYLEKDLASVIVGALSGYIGANGSVKRSQYMNEGSVEKKELEK